MTRSDLNHCTTCRQMANSDAYEDRNRMIRFPNSSHLVGSASFSEDDVLRGTSTMPEQREVPGRIWVEIEGGAESLCFYGTEVQRPLSPLVYLEGDCSRRIDGVWSVFDGYTRQSPYGLQQWAEQIALSISRTFINLARPGVCGSTGDHQQRRRPREVAIVDAALTGLKEAFGWTRIDLAGLSGGGHLVAALMAQRSDIGCAVIASGNVSVRQRNQEKGWAADITGYSDFVDPINLVAEVARQPPQKVIVLTDPLDQIVSATCQLAYVEALKDAGVTVEHRFIPSTEPTRHVLRDAALLAAATNPSHHVH